MGVSGAVTVYSGAWFTRPGRLALQLLYIYHVEQILSGKPLPCGAMPVLVQRNATGREPTWKLFTRSECQKLRTDEPSDAFQLSYFISGDSWLRHPRPRRYWTAASLWERSVSCLSRTRSFTGCEGLGSLRPGARL